MPFLCIFVFHIPPVSWHLWVRHPAMYSDTTLCFSMAVHPLWWARPTHSKCDQCVILCPHTLTHIHRPTHALLIVDELKSQTCQISQGGAAGLIHVVYIYIPTAYISRFGIILVPLEVEDLYHGSFVSWSVQPECNLSCGNYVSRCWCASTGILLCNPSSLYSHV